MPRKTISDPVFDKKRDRWRVTVPVSMSQGGKRVRSWHKTREAARAYITRLSGGKELAAVIPPALAMKADEARAILEPWKLDIVQAAREVANALEILSGAGSITQAAKAFRATHNARSASNPLGVSIALYLASRADLRDSTLKSYSYTLDKVLSKNENSRWQLAFRREFSNMLSTYQNATPTANNTPTPAACHHVPGRLPGQRPSNPRVI